MDKHRVKESVVAQYSKLAKMTRQGPLANLFGCCDPISQGEKIAVQIGYSSDDMTLAPEGANLGVGCGNPAAMASIKSGETVVDLGSGAGFDAFIVASKVGSTGRVVGVDLSDDMLSLARHNAQQGNFQQVAFVKGDIEQLPLDNQFADHVISNCVINLSQNKPQVFREAYRVLKDGGKLSISDVILEKALPAFIQNSLAGYVACVSGAEQLDTYVGYIQAAGFRDIRLEHKGDFPLEVMLQDPNLQQLARSLNISLDGPEAKELASRVKSISLTAYK